MIKTIKINNNQSIELNGSMGWFLVYRETFGRDILPDIMPLLESGLTMAINILQSVGVDNDGNMKGGWPELVESIDDGVLADLFINMSGLEASTILQIIWALAKNANEDTPPLKAFLNEFDVFPFDVIVPKVIRLIINSTVSSKNAKRLTALTKAAAGFQLTRSSSRESTGGSPSQT